MDDRAFDDVVEILLGRDEFYISSHVNPDGDSLGSLTGLAISLHAAGKKVLAALPDDGPLPPQYTFMPGLEFVIPVTEMPGACSCFIALDCGKADRLENLLPLASGCDELVNIDHHVDNTRFGSVNLIESRLSSTSEIVYALLLRAGMPVTPEVATSLYAGLMTDTGRFMHDNTNTRTFRAATELVALGADPHYVASQVYENQSIGYVRLMGLALARAVLDEDIALISSCISQEDLASTGASIQETEDLIDRLRVVGVARVAVLLKELRDGRTRASLRSSDGVDIAWLARKHGGGGHPKAAGFTSETGLQETLEVIRSELRAVDE
ncbi:MAG: DHH family phosphoesterase [Candidatus Geothermincolia bacterium]